MLDINQCGCRSGPSTLDHLVRVETTIRKVLAKLQHCVSVFFDLEKAKDTTWRWGIIRDLYWYGVRGRILRSVQSYLSARTFTVRIDTTLSIPFVQDNGVRQGGVLSVNLFAVKLNPICNVIPTSISYSLHVVHRQTSFSSCNVPGCERQWQLTINKMTK